jgi:hypothetical protein
MKQLLLLSLFITSITTFSQNNAPVAADDTIQYYYDDVNIMGVDTFDLMYSVNGYFLTNDGDPDNDHLSMDTAFLGSSSSNSIELLPLNNSPVIVIRYSVLNPFHGVDTITYIIKDDGNPVMYDTARMYIIVKDPVHEILNANNVNARVDIFSLFNSRSSAGFEAPAGTGKNTIFGANLWVAGKSNNTEFSSVKTWGWAQNFAGSVSNYGSNTGPVSNTSSQYLEFNPRWDKVWKVTQADIDYHLANWNSVNYSPPPVFNSWPAHGDTTLGEAFDLAPFIDNNNDGVYDPYVGDYPVIKGDQAIYFIYNDGGSDLSVNPMTSEVHGMAYAFQCQDSALQNTIFVDYRIINRSNNTYDSTCFGMWADFDLGNAQDDYLQCDVDRSLFYAFNGDDFDEANSGRSGYEDHIPAQSVMILKGAKQDDDGQDNLIGIGLNETVNGSGFGDGIADNEYWGMEHFIYYNNGSPNMPNSDPQSDEDFYNYLTGIWKDGTHMIYGGTGHPNSSSATNIPAKYMFPGNSDGYNYGTGGVSVPVWNEVTAGNTPSDRRGTGSTGPITFAPGDEMELTFAFVFGRDYVNTGAQAGVTNMLERADSIRSYYDQGMLSACGSPLAVKSETSVNNDLDIFPNPTQNVVHIKQQKAKNIRVEVIDATGKLVFTTTGQNQLTTIDLSGYTNGLYFIKVSSDKGFKVTKVIKK